MPVKVNATIFNQRMKKLSGLPSYLLEEALTVTKENTPIKSGYARSHTIIRGNSVVSNYGYAGSLDAGTSKQAPLGFTKPTIEQLNKDTTKFVRKV